MQNVILVLLLSAFSLGTQAVTYSWSLRVVNGTGGAPEIPSPDLFGHVYDENGNGYFSVTGMMIVYPNADDVMIKQQGLSGSPLVDVKLDTWMLALYGEAVIVGVGTIPEPSSALLLLLGGAGLLLKRGRCSEARRPTSGLLLVLGGAMLALRRRCA